MIMIIWMVLNDNYECNNDDDKYYNDEDNDDDNDNDNDNDDVDSIQISG